MNRSVSRILAILLIAAAALPAAQALAAERAEAVFIGREIELPKSFVCGAKARKAGRYGLKVTWDESAAKSKLTVFKGENDVCEVSGETLTGADVAASKVRLLTRVNAEKKAIEIDVIMPTGVRGRIANQVFLLPLADKD